MTQKGTIQNLRVVNHLESMREGKQRIVVVIVVVVVAVVMHHINNTKGKK